MNPSELVADALRIRDRLPAEDLEGRDTMARLIVELVKLAEGSSSSGPIPSHTEAPERRAPLTGAERARRCRAKKRATAGATASVTDGVTTSVTPHSPLGTPPSELQQREIAQEERGEQEKDAAAASRASVTAAVTPRDVSALWHRHAPAGTDHDRPRYASAFEAIAQAVCQQPDPVRSLGLVMAWWWEHAAGPVKGGRVPAEAATPLTMANRIDRDLGLALGAARAPAPSRPSFAELCEALCKARRRLALAITLGERREAGVRVSEIERALVEHHGLDALETASKAATEAAARAGAAA